jgi:hypothetical protein
MGSARGAQQQVTFDLFINPRRATGIKHHLAPRLRYWRRCVPQHLRTDAQ